VIRILPLSFKLLLTVRGLLTKRLLIGSPIDLTAMKVHSSNKSPNIQPLPTVSWRWLCRSQTHARSQSLGNSVGPASQADSIGITARCKIHRRVTTSSSLTRLHIKRWCLRRGIINRHSQIFPSLTHLYPHGRSRLRGIRSSSSS